MASHTQLVSIRVFEIRAVVVGVVLRPQPRRPVAMAAVGDGRRVRGIHLRTGAGGKGRHLAVARRVQTFKGAADEKKRARVGVALPSGPGLGGVNKTRLNAQCRHHGLVEGEGAVEVGDADVDVGEQG
jgi:hypothetical protein